MSQKKSNLNAIIEHLVNLTLFSFTSCKSGKRASVQISVSKLTKQETEHMRKPADDKQSRLIMPHKTG